MTASVLVTGADGFIGSHTAEHLVRSGLRVRALCAYNSFGTHGWLDESEVGGDVELVVGDVRDPRMLASAVRGCDAVVHLAALIAIPYSYLSPHSYVETNVGGTLNVLAAATDAGVRRVVHVSTSEVYGTPDSLPISETHPLRAQSPYAASKIGADMMAEAWCRSFGLEVLTIRPFNTFGPRQSRRAVIPTILSQLIQGRVVRLGDLRPVRDFTYVTDTARALTAAIDVDVALPDTIHLGTGRAVTIGELVQLCAGVLGTVAEVEQDDERLRPPESEVLSLLSDPSRAHELLGWGAETSLEEGLHRTAAFISDHPSFLSDSRYVI